MSRNNINAVLVSLSIGVFPNTRQDADITDEVKVRKALGQGAGKWVKYKLPDESLSPIRKYAGEVRTFHYDHTCSWEDGKRLLSERARQNYDARMEEFQTAFFQLVDEFGVEYPNWIEHAKIMHARTFEPSDYPSWSLCRQTFKFAIAHEPVPRPDHFNPELQRIYGHALEAMTEQKIEAAVADTWDRLLKPVQAMVEKLSSPDAIFRDSLVENVKEVTALVPALNLTGDTRLSEAARVIEEQLANLNPETLRDSKVDRKEAFERAKNLVARFGGIGKRKLAA